MFGSTVQSLGIIRRKLEHVHFGDYRLVVVEACESGWAVNNRFGDIPCVMFHDSTPVATHSMILKHPHYGRVARLRSRILMEVYRKIFHGMFSNIDWFFPRTGWCGRSLVNDFGVPSEKISPATVGIDLDEWRPRERTAEQDLQLLFVGNDFRRKGGEFLLQVMAALPMTVRLRIVSSDPLLDSVELPANTELRRGIPREQMPVHYQESDLFVFPTYKTDYP